MRETERERKRRREREREKERKREREREREKERGMYLDHASITFSDRCGGSLLYILYRWFGFTGLPN